MRPHHRVFAANSAAVPTPQPPSPCYLLKIPPELRLHIYEYVSIGTRQVYLDIRDNIYVHGIYDLSRCHLRALHRTCKTIYVEATPILYQHAVFHLSIVADFHQIHVGIGTQRIFDTIRNADFLMRVQRLKINVYGASGKDEIAARLQRMRELFEVLGRGSKLKRLHIDFSFLQDCSNRDTEAIYEALGPLRCVAECRITRCDVEPSQHNEYMNLRLSLDEKLAARLGGKLVNRDDEEDDNDDDDDDD